MCMQSACPLVYIHGPASSYMCGRQGKGRHVICTNGAPLTAVGVARQRHPLDLPSTQLVGSDMPLFASCDAGCTNVI